MLLRCRLAPAAVVVVLAMCAKLACAGVSVELSSEPEIRTDDDAVVLTGAEIVFASADLDSSLSVGDLLRNMLQLNATLAAMGTRLALLETFHTNVRAAACPAGSYMASITADGTPSCKALAAACSGGAIEEIKADGSVVCTKAGPAAAVACSNGSVLAGFDRDFKPSCVVDQGAAAAASVASTAAFVGKLKGSACPDANSFLVDIAMDGTASCGGLDASQGSCDTGEVVQGLDSALKATCVEDKGASHAASVATTSAFVDKLKGSSCAGDNNFADGVASDGSLLCSGLNTTSATCTAGTSMVALNNDLGATCAAIADTSAISDLQDDVDAILSCASTRALYDGTGCVEVSGQDALCKDLLAYYQFENNVLDSSPNQWHGVTDGTMSYGAGKVGAAASFGGSNRVRVEQFRNYNWGDKFSVTVWVNLGSRPSSLQYGGVICNGYYSDGSFEIRVGAEESGGKRNIGGGIISQDHAFAWDYNFVYLRYNTWEHVTMTYDGTSVLFYLNGVLQIDQKQSDADQGPMLKKDLPLYIGHAGTIPNEYYVGLVDEARLYKRVLTQLDITKLMALTEASDCSVVGTFTKPATSCKQIQDADAITPGQTLYWLTAAGEVFQAECDFASDGGGWTLVLSVAQGSWTSQDWFAQMSAARQKDLAKASTGIWRFTATDGSDARLFILDKNPAHIQGGTICGSHVWATTSESVKCSVDITKPWTGAVTSKISCCNSSPWGVGSHTCGVASGWILFHNGCTYNPGGGHPCPVSGQTGTGVCALNKLWVR